jgi:glycosyltransferase involved in cell wall biosynthesis
VKIAFEAGALANDRQSGVYYYTQRLLRALLEIDSTDSFTLVYFGHPPDESNQFGLTAPNLKLRPITWLPRKLYSAFLRTPVHLPIDAVAGITPDIFIFPRFVRWPLRGDTKSIVIIHDTSYLDYPATMETAHFVWYLRRAVPRSLRAASHIVANSEATKRSLVQHYGIAATKITVVTPALDHSVFQPAAPSATASIKAKYGIDRDYLLYVGTVEPRKNVATILAAYQQLPAELRQRYQLVVAGGKGWKDAAITAALAALDPHDIVQTGFVAEADLPALYSGASIFVYPSAYEGWGMPVLEAMACGVPVITADNSSLPEAGGEAAHYVTAGDAGQLTAAMVQLLQDPVMRAAMSKRGIAHARQFTWQKSARLFHQLLEKVYRS